MRTAHVLQPLGRHKTLSFFSVRSLDLEEQIPLNTPLLGRHIYVSRIGQHLSTMFSRDIHGKSVNGPPVPTLVLRRLWRRRRVRSEATKGAARSTPADALPMIQCS